MVGLHFDENCIMMEIVQTIGAVRMCRLWIVIPCYNEAEVLPETASRLKGILEPLIQNEKIQKESRILFVNDCSKDTTWNIIEELHKKDSLYTGISLSHNKGQQNALFAGLMEAKEYADAVISMDADLQDDISILEKFIDEYNKGFDVVYGVRSSRKKDHFMKRFTAQGFYRVMQFLGAEVVYNHADYRLLSKRVLEALSGYEESNLFLRGIIPQIGFPSTTITYERQERLAGRTKYPLKKMISFAFDGITSFSIKPIRFVLNLGITIFGVSLCVLLWAIIVKIIGKTVSGWTSLVASIWMLGGLQLLSIGMIGEYIGKIYSETKRRPRYFIEKSLLITKEDLQDRR